MGFDSNTITALHRRLLSLETLHPAPGTLPDAPPCLPGWEGDTASPSPGHWAVPGTGTCPHALMGTGLLTLDNDLCPAGVAVLQVAAGAEVDAGLGGLDAGEVELLAWEGDEGHSPGSRQAGSGPGEGPLRTPQGRARCPGLLWYRQWVLLALPNPAAATCPFPAASGQHAPRPEWGGR